MARTFPQPEKKETPTQKLKRELAEAEAQRDGYQKEASSLRQQINGRLEETDSYKNLVKQVDRNTAIKQRDSYHAKVQQLEDERDTLRQQLEALQAAYEALQVTHERESTTQRNPFGAGRKRSYTAQLEQIMQLRKSGSSIRSIASELNIPSATVMRYIKENELK